MVKVKNIKIVKCHIYFQVKRERMKIKMKKLLIKIRTSIKFTILVFIATILIVGIVAVVYKPIYSVYVNGELIGYCSNKSALQQQINDYMENGDGTNDNLAFVSIDNLPTYKMCLLKRGITTNDDEILETVKATGVAYYRYYAILDDEKEKLYVADFTTAEEIVSTLKKKNSNNIDDISIEEKYETELQTFTSKEDAVSKLYEKKIVIARTSTNSGNVNTSRNMSNTKVSLGISLIKPITGTITSRFGAISSVRSGAHTGLDIAAAYGTTIKAAASGTVTFSGTKGSYGKLVVITHSNGVQTYYGHCSKLVVSVGDTVTQGQKIAEVGSTGNSTGNHLHLEIRVNGVAYNPQNYLY